MSRAPRDFTTGAHRNAAFAMGFCYRKANENLSALGDGNANTPGCHAKNTKLHVHAVINNILSKLLSSSGRAQDIVSPSRRSLDTGA